MDIGEYFCHYRAEWSVFLLTILTDVFTLFLILLSIIQAISLVVKYLGSYFNIGALNLCPCVPDASPELDAFLDLSDTTNGDSEEQLLTWDVHNTAHIGPRTSYTGNPDVEEI